jgi:hypothetical protein
MSKKVAMVKSRFFSVLLLIGVVLSGCEGENALEQTFDDYFVKYYGVDGNQQGVDLVVNSDGTLILLGNSEDNLNGKQYFLTKVNATGAIVWQKFYGDLSEETAMDVEPTVDGAYIIALQKRFGVNDIQLELVKVSGNGDVIAASTFGPNPVDKVKSVTPISDGGFLVTGTTSATETSATTNVFYYRCDANLVFDIINWTEDYGFGDIDEGVKIYETGSTYNLFMSTNATGLGSQDFNFHYAAIDNSGNPTSAVVVFPSNNDDDETLSAVDYDPSTGYALLGTSQSQSDGSKNIFLVLYGTQLYPTPQVTDVIPANQGREKLDLDGNFEGISITKSSLGGYLIVANEGITVGSSTTNNIVLVKVDAQGRYRWHRSFGAEFNDSTSRVAELPNGDIVLIGTVRLDSQDKVVLIKVNSEGQFLK